uniref:Uncharacterized protein n=1 Tax=Anguilla anguilla TaxID=7936 RepID=A0A0E9QJR2_ANGAN
MLLKTCACNSKDRACVERLEFVLILTGS